MLEARKITGKIEIEINIIGDRKMTQLNGKFLKKKGTTDVISFPLQEKKEIETQAFDKNSKQIFVNPDGVLRLGSIFISYPQTRRQANLHKLLVDEEISQLVEHGMLHLLGYHHE